MFLEVAKRQYQELETILLFWGSPFFHIQFRSEDLAFLVYNLGCSLDTSRYIDLCVSLLILILFHRSSIPRRRSICGIGSEITFLCGVVRFTTGLAGRVDNSWFSVISVVRIIGIAFTGFFDAVGVRVCLNTVITTIVAVTGNIFVGVSWVSLPFLS